MSEDDEIKMQKLWGDEIELLNRKIESWTRVRLLDHPDFHRTVERKRLLEREFDLSRQRQAIAAALKESAAPKTSPTFTHSPDYRSVSIRGQEIHLTMGQAKIIEILHRAYENGSPEVSSAYILEAIETPNGRWRDTFRSNPAAKEVLIRSGGTKGTLRLNL